MTRAGLVLVIALSACAGSRPAPPVQPTTAAAPAPATTPASSATPSEEADETVLMARRWKHAAYFNRIKHVVFDHWDPAAVWKALPEVTRTSLGTAQRATTLEVELAPDGKLVALAVATSSGVPELDGEAIRAFQASSPFDAVPAELAPLGKFELGFYFVIDGKSSLGVKTP